MAAGQFNETDLNGDYRNALVPSQSQRATAQWSLFARKLAQKTCDISVPPGL
jgi:hypothetical protein